MDTNVTAEAILLTLAIGVCFVVFYWIHKWAHRHELRANELLDHGPDDAEGNPPIERDWYG